MRTEPFVIDVTVTGFISGFICGPSDAQILHLFLGVGGAVSLLGGQAPPGVRVILTLYFRLLCLCFNGHFPGEPGLAGVY